MPQLMRWVRLPMLPPEAATGRFEAFLDSVEVDNNQLVGAEGILNWHQARIELGQGLDLGELALRLQNTEQGIQGTLQNQESPLEIGGDLSLDREGNFDLTLRVTPTDQASQQALAMLGMGGRSGTQTVRVRGQLTPDGLKLQQLNQG